MRSGFLHEAEPPALDPADAVWRRLSSVEQQRYFLHRIVLHTFAQKPLRIPTEILEHNSGQSGVHEWQGPVASFLRLLRRLCHGLRWEHRGAERSVVVLHPGVYVGCVADEHTVDDVPLFVHRCDDLGAYSVTVLLEPLLVLAPFGKQVTRVRFRKAVTENSSPETIDAFMHVTLPLAQALLGTDSWSELAPCRALRVQLLRRDVPQSGSDTQRMHAPRGVVLFECPVLKTGLHWETLRETLARGSFPHGRSVIQRLGGVVSTAGVAPTWGLRLISMSRSHFERWLSDVYISAVRVPKSRTPMCSLTVWAESADNCAYVANTSWFEDLDTFSNERRDLLGFAALEKIFYSKLLPRLRRRIRNAGRADTQHHPLLLWFMAMAPPKGPLQTCLGAEVALPSHLLIQDLEHVLGVRFHLQQDQKTTLWWLCCQGLGYQNWSRVRH